MGGSHYPIGKAARWNFHPRANEYTDEFKDFTLELLHDYINETMEYIIVEESGSHIHTAYNVPSSDQYIQDNNYNANIRAQYKSFKLDYPATALGFTYKNDVGETDDFDYLAQYCLKDNTEPPTLGFRIIETNMTPERIKALSERAAKEKIKRQTHWKSACLKDIMSILETLTSMDKVAHLTRLEMLRLSKELVIDVKLKLAARKLIILSKNIDLVWIVGEFLDLLKLQSHANIDALDAHRNGLDGVVIVDDASAASLSKRDAWNKRLEQLHQNDTWAMSPAPSYDDT